MLRDDEYIVMDTEKGRACIQVRGSSMCDESEAVGSLWKALMVVWMINIPHSLRHLSIEYSFSRKDGKNNVNGS